MKFKKIFFSFLIIVILLFSSGSIYRYRRQIFKKISESSIKRFVFNEIKNGTTGQFSWNPQVYINEIASFGYRDTDGAIYPWIELFNDSNEKVCLRNWYLVKNNNAYEKWIFPEAVIQPEGYSTVFMSGKNRNEYYNVLHTSFLAETGDILELYNDSDIKVDSIKIPEINSCRKSFSRFPDGQEFKFVKEITPNRANCKAGILLMFDDKRIDNQYKYFDVLTGNGAKVSLNINIDYNCQFLPEDNEYNLFTQFGSSLTESQADKYKRFISKGCEVGIHHYQHINAIEYIKQNGKEKYLENQIYAVDSVFAKYRFPRAKSFVYSGHKRNEDTDKIINLRFFNYRGAYEYNYKYKWDNSRFIKGVRLDHHSNNPLYILDLLYRKLPSVLDKNEVIVMWGHGIFDNNAIIDYYTNIEVIDLIIKRAKELGLKFYTQADLYLKTKPLTLKIEDNKNIVIRNVSKHSINIQGFYIKINDKFFQIKQEMILPKNEEYTISSNDICERKVLSESDKVYLLWPDMESVLFRHIVNDEHIEIENNVSAIKDKICSIALTSDAKTICLDDYEWFTDHPEYCKQVKPGFFIFSETGEFEVVVKSKFNNQVIKKRILVRE